MELTKIQIAADLPYEQLCIDYNKYDPVFFCLFVC